MGGEKSVAHSFCRMYPGSPPHGRGKVMKANKKVKENGITPAWAGKSRECRYALTNEWDHPRVGGEKPARSSCKAVSSGSPPRGRGKASRPSVCRGPQWDHPRVGGEKNAGFTKTDIAAGSPPRGRGKDSGTVHGCGQLRITPAWAGKSREIPLHLRAAKDHPCVGGEKL